MNYFPKKSPDISAEQYNKGKHIVANSYQAIEESDNGVVYADYWNIAIGLAYSGGDAETIYRLLQKSKEVSPSDFCTIATYRMKDGKLIESIFHKTLGQRYEALLADCNTHKSSKDSKFNTKTGMDLTGLKEELIDELITLMEKDQKYRVIGESYQEHWAEQTRLDKENQIALTRIFETYGYPGKSLVGERFMNHACLILEHGGEIDYQEKYFPLVVEAMKKGEVIKPVVRMLIDRIHWKKTGNQIFGSHVDIPFDRDAIISEVKQAYGL